MGLYYECQGQPTDPMTASRLMLISHAATEAQRRAAFPLDEPVLEREVVRIGGLTKGLTWGVPARAQVWSAPEQRAQQTSRFLGLSATLAEELRECNYGQWRGRSLKEVQAQDPDGTLAWLTDPGATPHGGESLESLIQRVGSWIDEHCLGKDTIAVTHPTVIRAAIVHGLQLPTQIFWRFDIRPLTLTDLRFSRLWTIRCAGCPLDQARPAQEDSEI
jgi:broad specificity phosphatase PhoE